MDRYRWYARPREVLYELLGGDTPRQVLSGVIGGGLLLAAILILGLNLSGILSKDVGDADSAVAVCEEYVRSQPNVAPTAVLDYDVKPGGDDFVIVGLVLGEGLVADGVPAERVSLERILSEGSSSFLRCTVRYHARDGSYELLRGSVTKTPLAP